MTKISDEDEILIQQMQSKAGGAHIHTVNKATHYVWVYTDRNKPVVLERLRERIRAFIATGDVKPLTDHMSRWF